MPETKNDSWCRACGADQAAATAECATCGTPMRGAATGPDRVGRVVRIGSALRSRPGVVIGEDGAEVTVLTKGETGVPMPAADLDRLPVITVPGPEVIGAAGRLWRVARACGDGALKSKWSAEQVEAAASRHAVTDIAARRAAARDALALGLDDRVGPLGLTSSEDAWYRAVRHAASGETERMLSWLEALPSGAYAPKVRLLAVRVADLLGDAALAARAVELLRPFSERSQEGRALYLALQSRPAPGLLDALVPIAADPALGANGPDLLATAKALRAGERIPYVPVSGLRLLHALDTYLAGRSGVAVDDRSQALAPVPVPLLDELIELGALKTPPRGRNWPAVTASYLRCRIDPGQASAEDLERAGFHAERARRCYLAGDSESLDALPAGLPEVRHYRALLRARRGAEAEDLAGLRPAAARLVAQIRAVRARAEEGGRGAVPDGVAGDPTCWPLIRDLALAGRLDLPGDGRDRFPACAAWLDLCDLQRLVFEEAWPQVRARGRDLLRRAELEVTRDEAQNMIAFAELQEGRIDEALRILEEALAGQYTVGLVVNAGVVAALKGSQNALPYLARVIQLSDDPDVRQAAVGRAVAVWTGDSSSPEYPDALRGIVRAALQEPQPDERLRTLLTLAANFDSSWLAGRSGVPAAGPGQADAFRYYQARARNLSDDHPGDLTDVARELVRIKAAGTSPDWVDTEVRWMADLLNDAVHTDFGKVAHLLAPIEVLISVPGLLGQVDDLVLAAQAGAHATVALAEQKKFLRDDLEDKLLFDTVARYRARLPELSEPQREYAGDELARCVSVAGIFYGRLVDAEVDAFGDEWDAINDRLRWDYQNRGALMARQRSLHAGVYDLVLHLGRYLTCLEGLPMDDAARNRRNLIAERVRAWTTELDRLRQFL